MSSFDPFEQFGLRRRGPRGPRTVRSGPLLRRWQRIALILAAVLVGLIVLFLALIGLRVQYLFLDNLGHSNVFWTPLVTKVLCFLAGAALVGGLVAANIPVWVRAARTIDERGGTYAFGGGLALAGLAGFIGGSYLGSQWQMVQLFLHRRDFGASDPVFHQDYGFFIFNLPFYDAIQGMLWGVVIVSLLGTIVIGALCGAAHLLPEEMPVTLRPPAGANPEQGLRLAVRQGGVLLAAVFVLAALGAHFGVYHLATAQHDGFVGLDATQRDVVKPVLGVLQYVALIFAVLAVVVTVRTRSTAGTGAAAVVGGLLGGWLVLAGIVQIIPAAIYSAARVNPNAAQLQLPPISDYLATSRDAWALQPGRDVDTRKFGNPPGSPPTAPTVADLSADPNTLANVRLQDLSQLPEILQQIDKVRRSYQTYPKVSVDRYATANGGETTVMLGPREIEEGNLPSQTFTNQSFVFTHGAGATAISVNQLDNEGNPQVLASIQQGPTGPVESLASGAPVGLAVSDPRIYCGLQTTLPVVVNTTKDSGHDPEFDGAGTDAYSSYGNLPGGLPVPGALDRLALSLDQFHGLDLFLTSSTTSDSRILLHREITDRVQKLAPWLVQDGDPYIVADPVSGHFDFILDGYVSSDQFPEAFRQQDGTSYKRNAVKAVVDARTCSTTLYAVDLTEPLTAAYNDIYPGLLAPLDQMPVALRAHLRYPEDLFNDQAQVFTAAHIDPSNPSNLFTKTDLYRIADDSTSNYVELTLPNDTKASFVLLQTFSPNASGTGSANNMVQWFAASCDYVTSNHPKLVAVPLAGGNVLGVKQFDNNLNTDPGISQQLTLLGQSGSKTFLGQTVVLPFNENSFLYVRPFYVQAAGGSFPQIRYVLVGHRDRVAFGSTLGEALQKLFGQAVPGVPASTTPTPGATPSPTPSPGASPTPAASPTPSGQATPVTLTAQEVALLQDLIDKQAAVQRDLAAKDYDAYGRDQAAVQKDIDALRALLGPSFTVVPSTSPTPTTSATP